MPKFEVTFRKNIYLVSVQTIEADNEDHACDQANEMVKDAGITWVPDTSEVWADKVKEV